MAIPVSEMCRAIINSICSISILSCCCPSAAQLASDQFDFLNGHSTNGNPQGLTGAPKTHLKVLFPNNHKLRQLKLIKVSLKLPMKHNLLHLKFLFPPH